MSNSQNSATQVAVGIGLIGFLYGYGVALVMTYLPRDPFGMEPVYTASVPVSHFHVTAAATAIVVASVIAWYHGSDLLAEIRSSPTSA